MYQKTKQFMIAKKFEKVCLKLARQKRKALELCVACIWFESKTEFHEKNIAPTVKQ